MKKVAVITGSIFGGILVIYIGLSIFFMSHYWPGTVVNSVSCGWKNANYVERKNETKAKGYILTIKDRNEKQFNLPGNEYSYKYINKNEEKDIVKEQNGFGWVKGLFSKSEYTLNASVDFDADALKKKVESLEIFDKEYIQKPMDAHIDIDEEHYELVPEVMGNEPISEVIIAKAIEAVEASEPSLVLSDDCYVAPEILSDDPQLDATKKQIESYLASTIHYEIEGVDENLSKEDILKMLSVKEDGSVVVNEDKVAGFVQGLATKYNTYGDVRKFKTSSGDTVEVGGGDYGWVISKAKEKDQIMADLAGGQAVSREPVYEQTALVSGLDDIGNTYVEIDYTKQHLWYYKEGELQLETDIVSGCLANHNGSVDGIYKIIYKERNATLNGEGYSTAVKYFMPFAYNIGIHDAGWRDEFGGEIFRKSGSHGCINVPPKKAEKLFEILEKGTPVVAYYREKVKLTNNAAMVSNAYSYVKEEDR